MDDRPDHRPGPGYRHIAVGPDGVGNAPRDVAELSRSKRGRHFTPSFWAAALLGLTGRKRRHPDRRLAAPSGGLSLRDALQPASSIAHYGTVAIAPAATPGAKRLGGLIAPLCGDASAAIAAGLMARFGSLSSLFGANRRALQGALPDRPDLIELLLAVRPLVGEMLRAEMLEAPVLPDNRAAIRYLHARMAHQRAEQVRLLYLDAKNRVLSDEVAARGSVTKTDIFPREIVRRALDLGATGLIMAHNHPSGDPEPSRHDLAATRAVADAARLFDLVLHDHIILGRAGYRSLSEEGFI